jgi:hypothetical protein
MCAADARAADAFPLHPQFAVGLCAGGSEVYDGIIGSRRGAIQKPGQIAVIQNSSIDRWAPASACAAFASGCGAGTPG